MRIVFKTKAVHAPPLKVSCMHGITIVAFILFIALALFVMHTFVQLLILDINHRLLLWVRKS